MIKKRINQFSLLLTATCLSFGIQATELKPSGLLTDLIEHTERTWINGYPSNIPVWQTDGAIEPLQFVQISSRYPSFSWIVPGKKQDTQQTAYRMIVSKEYADAADGKGTVWDSGLTDSNQSTAVLYKGTALQPGSVYFWRVKTVTNTEGESQWSDIKAFRTASDMADYGASYYPQVKTMEQVASVRPIAGGAIVGDFGKDAFGQLLLTLTSHAPGDTVVVHLGECLATDGRINRKPGGTIRYRQYPLALLEGTHTYRIKIAKDKLNTRKVAVQMPDYVGEVLPFRYCEIENYRGTLKPEALAREVVHYPFNETASSFSCSNDTLNQIWDLCKYSIKATSFAGIYVDGDRERIPYEADALINQLSHYGVDREYSLARRSYEYLLNYPTWPTEWILQAALIAYYDYQYTGDNRSLKATYQQLKPRTLMGLREKNGFISTTTGLQTPALKASVRFNGEIKDIVDWPHTGILGLNDEEGGETDGFVFTDYNVVTNAYHYEALKVMALIAAALELPAEEQYYTTQSQTLKERFNRSFFDKKKGVYTDGITEGHASLHGNMFPLAFNMVPVANKQSVLNFIQTRGMACSVYGSQFLMDALYQAGGADYALHMLTKGDDRSWYNMLRVGSTISLEAWDNKYKPNQDWNHAWGSAPANIIPRKLMGVEPVEPGFGLISIKPQIGSLAWAKSVIPTIKGTINMQIENTDNTYTLRLTIPANMTAMLYLPLPSGKYEISNNGVALKTTRLKGEPFLDAGKLTSGTHLIRIVNSVNSIRLGSVQ